MRFPVDHRTMHQINKKFNLWKVLFSCLAYVRFLVTKGNLLQNTSDVSWIMWKLQWNWDSHSHWSWLQTFNYQPKSIQHITHTVCYHILDFFESTIKMRLEVLLKWKRNMFQFSYGTFLNFVKYCYDISKKIDCCSQFFKLPRMPAWML